MNEFIRKLDGLGRIVIPKDYRKKLQINDDSKLKLSLSEEYIKIEKYSEIDNNIEKIIKFKKIIQKELDINVIITDLDNEIENKIILDKTIIEKIKYGKCEIINQTKDLLLNTDKLINMIIVPIILYGEIIGSIIGYSYKREIDDLDKKIISIAKLILIKDIED